MVTTMYTFCPENPPDNAAMSSFGALNRTAYRLRLVFLVFNLHFQIHVQAGVLMTTHQLLFRG